MRIERAVLGWIVGLALVSGCRMLTEVRFAVDPSPLDYLQLVQHRPLADGQTHTTVLELQGSGYLAVRSGAGERARSGFWTDDPLAGAVRRDHRVLSREQTRQLLQQAVDTGAFDRDRPKTPPLVESPLFVQVNIGGRKNLFVTGEPAFRELFESLARQLER